MNKDLTKKNEGKSGKSEEGNCPVCGYFVGLAPTCARCGARVEKRIAIKVVRKIAIFGSILGIILLWYAAILKEPEPVKLGDISATMNNALVEVTGRVTSIDIDEEKNSLKLTISDGTGDDLGVNAINKLNKFREALGDDMPGLKDTVKVVGALNVSQSWGNSMFLSLPSRLQLVERYKIKDKNIGDITAEEEGELYRINATVKEYEQFTTNSGYVLNRFLLSDNTGDIEMVLFSSAFESLPEKTRYAITQEGSRFQMLVNVSTYRGDPQVEISDPSNPKHIQILHAEGGPAPKDATVNLKNKNASDLSAADVGKSYKVTAYVEESGLGGEGYYISLSGTDIDLFVSYDQEGKISNFDKIKEGAKITAPMKVVESDYGPELQIKNVNAVVVN